MAVAQYRDDWPYGKVNLQTTIKSIFVYMQGNQNFNSYQTFSIIFIITIQQ